MNKEDTARSLTVTSSLTSSTIKRAFSSVISAYLSISDVKMDPSKIFRNFQNGRHFEVQANFKPEVVPEVESYTKIGHAIPYILRFCSTF